MKKQNRNWVFLIIAGSVLMLTTRCKKEPVIEPTSAVLTTSVASSIAQTTALSGGNVTSDGGSTVTARGVCWSTGTNPTTADSKTNDGLSTGIFQSSITGLTANTAYSTRAFAINGAGTSYGNAISFTTLSASAPGLTTSSVTAILQTTATSGGTVTSDGGSTVTTRGVCWSTSANPTISDGKTTDGSGTGSFVSNITGLVAFTTYHIRAYATNSGGTGYGSVITFTTLQLPVPELTTSTVTGITLTTATSGGQVTSDGGLTITARGVCWSTGPTPNISNSKTTDGPGTGSFSSNLTGLAENTMYYLRAYATTSAGTGYGNAVSFTTLQLPLLTTSAASDITQTTASGGGDVTSEGSSAITARGICWGLNAAPTTADNKTTDGADAGIFASSMTGLNTNTTYHVRAYATNSAGTAYGNEVTFTTFGLEDIEGNGYHTVIIGTQEWMKENLKTTTYRDGSAIPNVTDATAWTNLTTGAYSDFDNSTDKAEIFGRLYNLFAVADARHICPAGWHEPLDAEWDVLATTLGGATVAGRKMKATETLQNGGYWNPPNTDATNESGFTGLAAGCRCDANGGLTFVFTDLSSYGHWWAADGNWFRRVQDSHGQLERFGNSSQNGKSVRCVKD